MEIIFLGTGTSSSLPHLDCLTAPPDKEPCHTCLSTLRPEGKKNIRRNTSAVLRIDGKDGKTFTVIIDVGKNFLAAALEWFPKYGLRHIDAVLITHAHADAMNGLDDLRGWTLKGAIQSHIDLYVSQATLGEVGRSFPYLVSKEFASGGGDVPDFKWNVFSDKIPFEIKDTGIKITPFTVHHGRIFGAVPPPAFLPTPNTTAPSTPERMLTPSVFQNDAGATPAVAAAKIHPYLCYAFKVNDDLVYMADVSYVPDDAWPILKSPSPSGTLPVLVLDCLGPDKHISHFGLADAVATARKVAAKRTYLLGSSHKISHEEYVTFGEVVGGRVIKDSDVLTPREKEGLGSIPEGDKVWLRPAHDGLRIEVSEKGIVKDDTYDL